MTARPQWTSEKPPLPEWYWIKTSTRDATVHEFLYDPEAESCGGHAFQPATGALSTEGWELFAGPIEEPCEKEAK